MIVETGAGIADADSYVTLGFANQLMAARGETSWDDLDDGAKEVALIKASAYLDNAYGKRWPGIRLSRTQGLLWPRYDAVDNNGYSVSLVPKEVQVATVLSALRAVTEDLQPDAARGGSVSQVTVGPITQVFSAGAQMETSRPEIDGVLGPLIGRGVKVSR